VTRWQLLCSSPEVADRGSVAIDPGESPSEIYGKQFPSIQVAKELSLPE
jgi:hypothetical protein